MSIKETLDKLDEKFLTNPRSKMSYLSGDEKRELVKFVEEEIKLAMKEIRNIDLATDMKTISDVGKLNYKAEAFGYAQAWMCKKINSNISKYFEV